jgi:hypothetical protein
MAFLCNYQKYGTTFSNAYVRIERINYVAKPERITTRPEPTIGENGLLVEPGPNETVETFQTAKRCNLVVMVYHSEASRLAAESPIDVKAEYIFDVTPGDTLDLFDQGYAYLKTLPEFTGAVDA